MERERMSVFRMATHAHTDICTHRKQDWADMKEKKNPSLQHFTHKTELINFLCAFCTFLFNECDR